MPATLPEMDDTTFADWLGPMSTGASAFFEDVTQLMNSSSPVELSVYGGLWVWGDQRTSPWNTPDIPHHDRGELVVAGDTSELAKALAGQIGGRVSLRTRVLSVKENGTGNGDGYLCLLVSLSAHERCPEGGRAGLRTYNRNQMMPAPIYGPEEL